MKLYYSPKTRAGRPRWMLEELEVPYELMRIDLRAKENRRPEYLRIHPLGQIPALVDGDVTLFESAAICMYLADRFPERQLAPAPGSPLRAATYQWLLFGPATLEPPLAILSRSAKTPGSESIEAVDQARERFATAADVLATALLRAPFLVDGRFSVVDVITGANLAWARRLGLLETRPVLESYVERLLGRPAARRAFAD